MSQYENLTDQQFLDFAKTVPARSDIVDLHDYVANVRALVAGDDPINIPESHLKLSRGENHEGSGRLNARIRQLSAWLSAASPRFSIRAAGVGTQVRRGASAQERFARGGEAQLAKGTSLNRWRQQFYRDIAESGVGVMQMNPRPGYYLYVRDHPDVMAEGSSLSEIMHMRRIDPAAVGYVSTDDGDVGLVVTQASRALGALAEKIAVDDMKRVLGFFDWGVELDPTRPEAWDPTLSVEVAEVWGPNNGALVVTGGNSSVATNRFGPSTQGRIIARWRHQWRRPPFYFATAGTTPYHSPLDEMVQLTAIRNFWATMLDLQASGAIFRHWQLVDINSGQDVTDRLPRDAAPEHLRYDLSKPPPNMGPGTEWKLAPFEFYDVTNRHAQVVAQHEAAGASVARLVGQAVNQNTPVGTADMINDSAREEFAEWIEAIEATIE
ncbi:MAG: hypothetical protein O2976_05590, partial [Actinomycetota bacterium]|nr:hypothetical protein [Actinomycetota bacterium]